MTDLAPTLTPIGDDGQLLALPLSQDGSTLTLTLAPDELAALDSALTDILFGQPGTVHGYGIDLELTIDDERLHIQVTGDHAISALAVLPLEAIGQLAALITEAGL